MTGREPKILTVTTRVVRVHAILELTFRLNQDMKAGEEVVVIQEVIEEDNE